VPAASALLDAAGFCAIAICIASPASRRWLTRHIALATSRQGELTLACRNVMQVTREIARKVANTICGKTD
jgi:hypothetical protein